MNATRIRLGLSFTLKMISRRRIILLALVVIPSIFISVIQLTASDKIVFFQLASLDNPETIGLEQRGISLIFFTVTTTGFLVSFLSLNLIQIDYEVNRRLVISGYHPLELLITKAIALMLMNMIIAIYISMLAKSFYPIKHLPGFILGLFLTGFVYGGYGLFVGSIIRGELEGILMIVLLANIDVGWLQNPVFFADSHNKDIIRYLPGFYPSQASVINALTDHSAINSRWFSLLYGLGFIATAMGIYYRRMRRRQ
jgi:hypothetical protein